MKIVKFRYFDSEQKKMIYSGEFSSFEGFFAHFDNSNQELNYFTGLHDKNGNPIFEGDIVADEYGDDEMQGIITYDAKSAKYIRKSLNTIPEQDDFMDDLYEPRVIGTIYENHELLNK